MANKKVERKKKADPKYLEKKKARVEKKNWFDAKETKVAEKRAKKDATEKAYKIYAKKNKNKLFYPALHNQRDWMLSLKPEDLVPENPSLRFYFQPRMKFDNFDDFYQLQQPKVNFHAWVEDENGKVIFDPFFEEYLTDEIHGLERWGASKDKPVYMKWSEGEQMKQKESSCMIYKNKIEETRIFCIPEEELERELDTYCILRFGKEPQYNCCYGNARAFVLLNNRGKVVIGALGYKRPDGEVYFLYG